MALARHLALVKPSKGWHKCVNLEEVKILAQRDQAVKTVLATMGWEAPIPIWVKNADEDFRMEWLNLAYVDTFLRPYGLVAGDYLGKNDYSVWPQDIADEFRKHDRRALAVGRLDGLETDKEGRRLHIIKTCHTIGGQTFIRGQSMFVDDILGLINE